MPKCMIFIDGTWLYHSNSKLAEAAGQKDFQVDFGKLPKVLAEEVGKQLGGGEIDVVRTILFGSYASNYDLRDEEAVQRQLDFFAMLKEEYHYEIEIYPINYRGRRLKKIDRAPEDYFEPKEKCVDVSLTTNILFYAAIPTAYDIAVVVAGDQDYKPVLQHVRLLGKRVAIASIRRNCAQELADPRDEARVKDFDLIWLEDLLSRLELKYEKRILECESPMHKGDRKVWTTYRLRKGQKFYCDACRAEFAGQKQQAQQEFMTQDIEGRFPTEHENGGIKDQVGVTLSGEIVKMVPERGFGFIRATDGKDYFFHLTDLSWGLEFENLQPGHQVDFDIKREPSDEKAGAAQKVRPHAGHPPQEDVGFDDFPEDNTSSSS